jgi:sirohydrochlorin ferrochelatase
VSAAALGGVAFAAESTVTQVERLLSELVDEFDIEYTDVVVGILSGIIDTFSVFAQELRLLSADAAFEEAYA